VTALTLKESDSRSHCQEVTRLFAEYMGPWHVTKCTTEQLGLFRSLSVSQELAPLLDELQRDQSIVSMWSCFTKDGLNETQYLNLPSTCQHLTTVRTWRLTCGLLIAISAMDCQASRPFNLLSATELVKCATIAAMWEPGTKIQYSSAQLITGVTPRVMEFVGKLPAALVLTSLVASPYHANPNGPPKQARRDHRGDGRRLDARSTAAQRASLNQAQRGGRLRDPSATGGRYGMLTKEQQATVGTQKLCMNCFQTGHKSAACTKASVDVKMCPVIP
jgi:hypothetical protein